PDRLPTRRLIEKALVADQRFVARPSHWPGQQFRNISLQNIVSGKPDSVLHVALFQCCVELGLGEGRIGGKTTSLPCSCWRSISGNSSSSQPSALGTLPGRSLAARQSPSRLNSSSGW